MRVCSRSIKRTGTVVVGLEQGKERADGEDVCVIVQHDCNASLEQQEKAAGSKMVEEQSTRPVASAGHDEKIYPRDQQR